MGQSPVVPEGLLVPVVLEFHFLAAVGLPPPAAAALLLPGVVFVQLLSSKLYAI